ncbi:MAG TPA: hypothetical protein PLB35_05835 [Myxococcota bacterium]|nr:hypothetical protein [Myxococcota bacterium]HOH76757.1 hypothetical protein [Myxococcota bacterium]
MHDQRIFFECDECGRPLECPQPWAGRQVCCPSCGHSGTIPPESTVAGRRVPQVTPSEAMRRPAGVDSTAGGARPGDIVLSSADGFVTEHSLPARSARRPEKQTLTFRQFWARYKVFIVGGIIVVGALAWWGSWKWYYRNYVRAEAIMKNRGYGRKLDQPLVPNPEITRLIGQVDVAESRQFAAPEDVGLTMELAAAYDAALKEIGHIRGPRAAAILNNAAWLLSTTPHLGLRDPGRALKLAESAVVQTCRKNAGYLDTLAHALAASGRPAEALEVAREALALKPDDQYLKEREREFSDVAGTGPGHPADE